MPINRFLPFFFFAWVFLGAVAAPLFGEEEAAPPTNISVRNFYHPNYPDNATTRRLIDLMRENPQIKVRPWGGISLPGGAGKASLMMAIAGGTAPDMGEAWFHIIQNEIKQQFLAPLNEWICKDYDPEHPDAWDKNHNGMIDDDEAAWEPWKQIPPLWRRVATVNGKVYGLPQTNRFYVGIVFRTDLAQNAGLNPNRPPRTWAELKYWSQKLSSDSREAGSTGDRRGIAMSPYGWQFIPWMQSAGAEPIVQARKSPTTGAEHLFPLDVTKAIASDGEDLSEAEPTYRAYFDSPAGVAAAGFYHTLFFQRWIFDPETNEPIDLTAEDVQRGAVTVDGREIKFDAAKVFTGMARANSTNQQGQSPLELLARGEVAMVENPVNNLDELGNDLGLNPELLSWFPIPAMDAEHQEVLQQQTHFIVAYEQVARRSKVDRDRIWQAITAIADERTRENAVREKVLAGVASYVNPAELRAFGYEEYIEDIPQNIRTNYVRIANGEISVHTEPWLGYWVTMDSALNTQVLSLTMVHDNFDYAGALTAVTRNANGGVMFETPKVVLDEYRPWARAIAVLFVVVLAVLIYRIVRVQLRGQTADRANANVHHPLVPYLLIIPTFGLIALWNYYPLLRGMVMAFQDYRIAGESTFVGMDNFIVLALDRSFWMSLLRTCLFVFLNMTLAFTAPIILAVLLTELPRFRIFYRTLFFLPQMTSGLVIALLWKLMYNPTPQGFFNQILSWINYLPFVNIAPQTWLLDPKLAMVCCVLPTVWASMGMASLIYLAALHSIPTDFYDAADLDGAGVISKLWHITIPTILPLIIINFVGAFIGTFQNMGNIFLLTFGGPGEATTVTGLKIWIEAYNNLRFSMATSMAWVLGSLLIGFTYFQIKFLSRVEYRQAKIA